jgi:hypothetical protein
MAILLTALLVPGLLAGCAGPFQAQYPIVKAESPQQALTQFNDPVVRDATQVHVSYLASFEFVDYARIETSAFILESAFAVATSEQAVLQYDWTMARMVETWNVNKGKAIGYGPVKKVQAWHGLITYRPYRMARENRSCIAFDSEWAYQARDPQGRPTRVFFGYICAPPGKPLNEDMAATLLGSVRFTVQNAEKLVPVDARRSIDQSAFDAAKGVPGGATGNAKYPFNFGTIYVEGGPERTS